MTGGNRDQIEFWSGVQGRKWLSLQEGIDRMMAPFTDAGLEALGDIAGKHCLDIGCGAGATSLALADAAGASGAVTGIDVSTPMLGRARERAEGRGNLCFVEADAQHYDFPPAAFEILFSRFGIMFFHDPAAAFVNLLRAGKPGARFTALTWRQPRENPWVMVPVSAAKDFVELPGRPAPGEPGQFQWSDPDLVTGWLGSAGWSGIRLEPLDVMLTFPGSTGDVAGYLIQMGPAASLLVDAGGDVKDRAEAALANKLEAHVRNGAVRLGAACWVVSATAP